MLARSREAFDAVPDFTVAVEEEFALLDPETLGLVNRFEELQQAALGTELEPHLVGELIALSGSSPFVEGVFTYLHSARTQIFTRMFPRCGIPDALTSWDDWETYVRFLYETGSITENTQIWWSVRPHLAFPTVEIRICDAQPDVGESRSLAALCYALTARIARAVDEGEPLPDLPHRLIEENLWRAIRHGLSGELIDFAGGESVPARARLEGLVEWVRPVAEELGAADWLAIPERTAAERQIARHEDGASMREIFDEQVRWHLST